MPTVEEVRTALKDVLDPEYPISIVDLGLIRGVEVEGNRVIVSLTYTSLGCPCTEMIRDDVETRLRQVAGVESVEIREVFESWSRANISKEGLIQLRRVGVV